MAKKVTRVFLRGGEGTSFTANGDRFVVPDGKTDINELLKRFPEADRLGIALIAANQGVEIVYESEIVAEDGDVVAALPVTPAETPPAPTEEEVPEI